MPKPHVNKRDFLIRDMPIELYDLLEKSAKEHHRSKTQEAIFALSNGLTKPSKSLKKPIPFQWGKKVSASFVRNAVKEGRE